MKTQIVLFVLSTVSVDIFAAPGVPPQLYSSADGVQILDTHNFKNLVEHSTRGWLVNFYLSWCGDCQRFSIKWKELAKEISKWRDLITVGAVNCADETNNPICTKFGVGTFPFIKYFHANNGGVRIVQNHNVQVDMIKKEVVETLMEEIRNERGSIYPNLLPYTHPTVEELFEGANGDVRYAIVVVDPPGEYLGAEVALDLHKTPAIVVRHAFQNDELVNNLGIRKLPAVVVLDREKKVKIFETDVDTRSRIKATLVSFLRSDGLIDSVEDTTKQDSTANPESQLVSLQEIKNLGDVIFQVDLESALSYSLQQEVGTEEKIQGEQLLTLQSYVAVIKKYFPFAHNRTSFITQLSDLTAGSEVQGVAIQNLVREAQANYTFSTSADTYVGCMGSVSTFRGYPCSLWRLFHFFTVNSDQTENPREILDTMLAYVKDFFGCYHCSQHFQRMAIERNLTSVSSLEESILWLWEAHNVVNARLKGDMTEDPEFPKEQFPTKSGCPGCYDGEGNWKKVEVLDYLKRMYGKYNVRYVGADAITMLPGLGQ